MSDSPPRRPEEASGPSGATPSGDDPEAIARIYEEVRRLAGAYMRRERDGHTLQPTALANEAWIRLTEAGGVEVESRPRFFAIAARCMRQILVDHARARNAAKRQGGRARLTLSDTLVGSDEAAIDVVDLHEALEALAGHDERKARIVELRFFAGLTVQEVADVLGVSLTTAEDDWYMARAWLKRRLRAAPP